MKPEDRKGLERGMVAALKEGYVAVPHLLLKYYARLSLTETEAMLLVHLIAFKEKEDKDFPTIEELQSRMSASPDSVIQSLQKMLKEDIIRIDEQTDSQSGIFFEQYNLDPLLHKLVGCWLDDVRLHAPLEPASEKTENHDIFTVFEKEFARPLTPMECEMISGWLDKDRHSQDLILFALKEAIFAGKVHFRYIDRILLEWSRNRVQTVEQAKEFARKFRGA